MHIPFASILTATTTLAGVRALSPPPAIINMTSPLATNMTTALDAVTMPPGDIDRHNFHKIWAHWCNTESGWDHCGIWLDVKNPGCFDQSYRSSVGFKVSNAWATGAQQYVLVMSPRHGCPCQHSCKKLPKKPEKQLNPHWDVRHWQMGAWSFRFERRNECPPNTCPGHDTPTGDVPGSKDAPEKLLAWPLSAGTTHDIDDMDKAVKVLF